jgi:hypothetical protein
MVGKILETIYSPFFSWCCFPYVHFCELYLCCVYCVILYVFVVSYVCLLHLTCICYTFYVFVVPYVYLLYYVCIAALTLYPEGPATGHLDTGFSCFRCVYKRMLRWSPSSQVANTCLPCSPPDLNFLVTFFHICVHVK